jgi:hypothetical protein
MTPKAIVDRLETIIGENGVPVRLISIIETELAAHFGLTAIEAAEQAEKLTPQVTRIICDRLVASDNAGTSPVLTIIGAASDIVAGSCHVLSSDSNKIAAIKRQRVHADALLRKLKSISFSEFEVFGKRVLEELGATRAMVTPQRNDQGIDFLGYVSLGQLQEIPVPFLKLAHEVGLLIAGQAKHRPNGSLGPDVIRELIGAISLARTKTFSHSGADVFKELEIRPFSPIVAVLFTTGGISAGALRLASSAGIIAKSGDQLAVFLADRGVGMVQRSGAMFFDEAKFDQWLAGYGRC